MIDWPEKTLGEICEKITDGAHSSPKSVLIGKPMASVKDLNSFGVDLISARKIAEEDYQKLVKQGCKPCIGDVLIAKDGNTALDTVCVQKENEDFVLLSSVAILRPNNREVMPDFLKYYFSNRITISYLKSNFISGAAIPRVVLKDFKKAVITLPPLSKQRAIVSVLSALDDKIENNRRMNETLEEMARAIFKSWFVDFDPVHAKAAGNAPVHMDAETAALFPSSFGDDGLPEGWKWVQIEDIAEQVAMGPFGSNIKVSTFVESGIPVISGKHLNGILLEDNGHNFVTEEHADRLKRSNVYRDDIVFTHAGNVGQVSIIPETSQYERYVLSQRGFYLRCDKTKISPQYVIYFFKSYIGQHKLLANVSSTGVPSIAKPASYLKSIELCLPSLPLLNKFDNLASLYHLKMGSNRNEIQTLAALRDTLLPKLMSGEIQIKEAEKQVSEAL